MKTMEDAQLRSNHRDWVCWICKKQINNMVLHPCIHAPRQLSGYETSFDLVILTTVCQKCLNASSSYVMD